MLLAGFGQFLSGECGGYVYNLGFYLPPLVSVPAPGVLFAEARDMQCC